MEEQLRNKIMPEALRNLSAFYECELLPTWAKKSIEQLVENKLYNEINNRFFKTLNFGTGGMRGRTIAEHPTSFEIGSSKTNIPEFSSIGSTFLNDFNIIGATIALFQYCKTYLLKIGHSYEIPTVVIAYDVRHFSKHFCELAASTWEQLGGHAMIYSSPRSTPQLSFSVRHLKCTAGIMITASHNPWHDNGYKAYFSDGAQMVEPHSAGVIEFFKNLSIDKICEYCSKDLSGVSMLDSDIDDAYQSSVEKTILAPDLIKNYPIHAVYSPLHGTGSAAICPLLKRLNIKHDIVEEQMVQDGNFPTVKSPNPENPEAMQMVIKRAKLKNANIAMVTDPDGDRLAIASRNRNGEFEIFSGNVTAALLAEYRIFKLKSLHKIPAKGTKSAAIIKTFVTTPLIDKIAERNGVKCINTLTGFKWIGQKMLDYENTMLEKELDKTGIAIDYHNTSQKARRELLLRDSTYFIFGCEESYGCLAYDDIRDKDANSACMMACELASHAKKFSKTLCELRDDMYVKYGYFGEDILNIYYEGADGANKIKNILSSYQSNPPKSIMSHNVIKITDFSKDTVTDSDGRCIPPQRFFFIELGSGIKFAVRASGTEPKIKFYLFAEKPVQSHSELDQIKHETSSLLVDIKSFLSEDANKRAV